MKLYTYEKSLRKPKKITDPVKGSDGILLKSYMCFMVFFDFKSDIALIQLEA